MSVRASGPMWARCTSWGSSTSLTGGYRLRLNDALSLDCSLALGYLRADYEKYRAVEGVRVRQGEEAKNWWGPIHAGLTLTWNLF